MSASIIKPSLFRFLRDLDANNNRDWFQESKPRYEKDLKEPCLEFITEFGAHLHRVSPHFRADPRVQRGSLFRIYRDIRFSRDKRPYKTHQGMHFPHDAGKNAHTPGFYLHLEPGKCFAGVGLWRPDTPTLRLLRERVAANPEAWRRAVENPAFTELFTVQGESLKRVPRGFPADHELADVLKLKDFTAYTPLTQKQITSPDFPRQFGEICGAGGSLVRFICEALGQEY